MWRIRVLAKVRLVRDKRFLAVPSLPLRLRDIEQQGRIARQTVGLLETRDGVFPQAQIEGAQAVLERGLGGGQIHFRLGRRWGWRVFGLSTARGLAGQLRSPRRAGKQGKP